MASEKLRQREVHKYYQSWLESSSSPLNSDAVPNAQSSHYDDAPETDRKTSKDRALTAFAQLGCLRLNVKRAVVTLIATHHQYILAEATKTLSLVSDARVDDADDEIWFGNASLPRSQGVSEAALTPDLYHAVDTAGNTFTAPALVIDDLTAVGKYASRGYAGNGVTFYCGVPIVTPAGIPIGVYNLTDDKPRNGLSPKELRFMSELATVLMGHLETIKNEAARHRGEAMVFGLGRFVEGASSLYEDSLRTSSNAHSPYSEDTDRSRPRTREFKGLRVSVADPLRLHHNVAAISSISSLPQTKVPPIESGQNSPGHRDRRVDAGDLTQSPNIPTGPLSDQAFSRAANVLRECAAADGVLFFDAVSTNLAKRSSTSGFRSGGDLLEHKVVSNVKQGQISTESNREDGSQDPDASDASDGLSSSEGGNKLCRLLGYSLNVDPDMLVSCADVLQDRQISERSLRRLIKRYPKGKLFSFCADGNVSSTDGGDIEIQNSYIRETADSTDGDGSGRGKLIARAIAKELKRLAPQAQNMIWLPIWDFSKQRWSSGAFLWSKRPERLVTAQDDLVYLRTFANSIMVEVARLDAATADTAKSTFIANVSHELRSPLHGILGNLDLLSETNLDDLQHSLVGAIEVCGKMLTDTVDHVLDYSKINQLSRGVKRRKKSSTAKIPQLGQSGDSVGGESLIENNFDLAVIVEEVVNVVYGSHVFRFKSLGKFGDKSKFQALLPKKGVRIILDIDYQQNWVVHSQPGAIRRVLTNLFENALKYTEAGTIQISLLIPASAKLLEPSSVTSLILTVKDTGRGMSQDFVRNHAFTPFTQESQFSTGAGLGLSIVQQIVNTLGGKIQLQSEVGVGTEFKIYLDLPRAAQSGHEPGPNAGLPRRLSFRAAGMRLRLVSPQEAGAVEDVYDLTPSEISLASTAHSWFGIEPAASQYIKEISDEIILYTSLPTADDLIRNFAPSNRRHQVPVVAIAANAFERAEFLKRYTEINSQLGPCLEVISYPIGPQKLGSAILRCLERIDSQFAPVRNRLDSLANIRSISSPAVPTALSPSKSVPSLSVYQPPRGLALKSTQPSMPAMTEPQGPSTQADDEQKSHQTTLHGQRPPLAVVSFEANPSVDRILESKGPDPDLLMTDVYASPSPLPNPGSKIPRLPNKPVSSLRSSRTPRFGGESEPNPADASLGPRVLLVDDNDINLNILVACMRRSKIPFSTAKDGLEALKAFREATHLNCAFTHVLMDITMPVMDGIEATKEIRIFERKHNNGTRQRRLTATSIVMSNTEKMQLDDDDSLEKHLASASTQEDITTSSPVAGTAMTTKTTTTTATTTTMEDVRKGPQAFIIALSGIVTESAQHEMFEAGADMFLPKPAKLKELVKIIHS